MRLIGFVLTGVVLASCATVAARPAWTIKNHPWHEDKAIYAVGTAPADIRELDVQLRVAELDALENILKGFGACGGRIEGKVRLEHWIAQDGIAYMLVRVDRVVLDPC